MASDETPELLDEIWWNSVSEPSDAHLDLLRLRLGDEEAKSWILASTLVIPQCLRSEEEVFRSCWKRWRPRALAANPRIELEILNKIGGRLVLPSDPEWPGGFEKLGEGRPRLLWVIGEMPKSPAIAIVGARASSHYGNEVASELASELSHRGYCTISGGAIGIDTAVHQGSVNVRGQTCAYMAGGLGNLYPASNSDLFRAILRCGGALVSEVPCTFRPAKWRFLGRNRLIAAAAAGVVVVEASPRSGALATARWALEMGTPVGGVPGSVYSEASRGVHELLRNGGILVRDWADIIDMIGEKLPEENQMPLFGDPTAPDDGIEALQPLMRRVFEALPQRRSMTIERAAVAAGLDEESVKIALVRLQLEGYVANDERGWHRSKSPHR